MIIDTLTLLWDTTSVVVDVCSPGQREFADRWVFDVAAGERGIDLSLLLMFITAASIAILGEGRIIDDQKMIGGGDLSAGDLLTRGAADGQWRTVQDVLAALGSHFWGD